MEKLGLKASVLIPCRNEVQNIDDCLENVLNFEPPSGGYEIIVIDGMSDDGTRDIINEKIKIFPQIRLLSNPKKTVPHAMNSGIRAAQGEYIVRTDVRCIHPRDYIVQLLQLSEETQADNVGGILVPEGKTYFQKGIATAYKSFVSMGGALRQRENFIGETDAVYGGCFKREWLLEIGMYDENMVRNQDDELSFRLRKNGGKIIQSTKIKVKYYPRKNLKQLLKQFLQYGFWKVFIIKKHPKQASPRHFAPSILVISIFGLGIAYFFNYHSLWAFLLLVGAYLLLVCLESVRISIKTEINLFPAVLLSIISIHIAFGTGFLIGLFCWLFNAKQKWFESLSR